MASVNKAILIGHLGADPEVRRFPNGDTVCNLRLATNEHWKDKHTGQEREATEWHRIVMFRRLAEISGQYLKKGMQVFIEGRLKTRKWKDSNGQDRYTTEIEASVMRILSSNNKDAEKEREQDRDYRARPLTARPVESDWENVATDFPYDEEGIPF